MKVEAHLARTPTHKALRFKKFLTPRRVGFFVARHDLISYFRKTRKPFPQGRKKLKELSDLVFAHRNCRQREQPLDALIEAIRSYEATYKLWGGYEEIGRDLQAFIEGDEDAAHLMKPEAAIDAMRGKRDNLKDDQRRVVLKFLKSKNLNLEINEIGGFEVTQGNKRVLEHYCGPYHFFYSIDPKGLRDKDVLSCRDVTISTDGGKLVGRSFTRETGFSRPRHEGAIEITTGVDSSDVMLFVCHDQGRREPPVSFMLNFVDSASIKMFYGIGIGLRFKNTRTVAAAKVIGLPAEWFPEFDNKLSTDHVDAAVIHKIMSVISGQNEFDNSRSLFFGFDYFDQDKTARQVLEDAAEIRKMLQA